MVVTSAEAHVTWSDVERLVVGSQIWAQADGQKGAKIIRKGRGDDDSRRKILPVCPYRERERGYDQKDRRVRLFAKKDVGLRQTQGPFLLEYVGKRHASSNWSPRVPGIPHSYCKINFFKIVRAAHWAEKNCFFWKISNRNRFRYVERRHFYRNYVPSILGVPDG